MNAHKRSNPAQGLAVVEPDQCGIILLDADLEIYYCNNLPSQRHEQNRRIPVGRNFFDSFPAARALPQFVALIDRARRGDIPQRTTWFDHPIPFPRNDDPVIAGELPQSGQGITLFRLEDPQRPDHFGMLVFERASLPAGSLCFNAQCDDRQSPPDTDLRAELEKTQRQLLQSEKMAAVGQLAAGVAHEINNPVGYVSSNLRGLSGYLLDLLRLTDAIESADNIGQLRQIKQGVDYDFLRQDIESLMAESQEGLDRINRIISALKDFSHHEEKESFCPTDLHRIIDSTINVVSHEIRYRADLVREYGDIPPVACAASQINQVVANLLVNAAHAMPDYGRITVRTGTDGDGMVWFEVEDTGLGIEPQLVGRIFEPFFTTKPTGQGTGLGLSLSYNIVQKHQGRIEVFSALGKGTRFRVWLPIARPGGNCAPGTPCAANKCDKGPGCR